MSDNEVAAIQADLRDLAARLHQARPRVLDAWSKAVQDDPRLTTSSALPRRQFLDHIPSLLDAFEKTLSSWHRQDSAVAADAEALQAAQHGLERWRQGYRLLEVMREWRHLQIILVAELEEAGEVVGAAAMREARHLLAELCGDGVCESADRYFLMQRAEADSRLRELELALANFEELERERADAWREAAHDLRGNLGVVKTATAVLTRANVADQARARSLDILHRGVDSMHDLLNELISLARLEAGREVRAVEPFDAAGVIRELCANMLQVAEARGLNLTYEGPESLAVRGDSMKVLRIAQNLVVNALTYTVQGFVKVSALGAADGRWVLTVADSGPGIGSSALSGLAVPAMQPNDEASALTSGEARVRSALGGAAISSRSGEGIGLSIVKRLCELLDATLELRSESGAGSTFIVSFPADYPDAPDAPDAPGG